MKNIKIQLSKVMMGHLAALAILVGSGGYAYAKYWNVATANGRNISRIDYIKNLEKQGGKQVLDQMIQEALIRNEAAKKGIKVDQKTVDDEIKKIEEKIKGQGLTLDQALLSQGMTKADLEGQIAISKMVTALVKSDKEITQAEIDKFLADNKAQLPKNATKDDLQKLAKEQLTSQATSQAASAWLAELKKNAKIIYR